MLKPIVGVGALLVAVAVAAIVVLAIDPTTPLIHLNPPQRELSPPPTATPVANPQPSAAAAIVADPRQLTVGQNVRVLGRVSNVSRVGAAFDAEYSSERTNGQTTYKPLTLELRPGMQILENQCYQVFGVVQTPGIVSVYRADAAAEVADGRCANPG